MSNIEGYEWEEEDTKPAEAPLSEKDLKFEREDTTPLVDNPLSLRSIEKGLRQNAEYGRSGGFEYFAATRMGGHTGEEILPDGSVLEAVNQDSYWINKDPIQSYALAARGGFNKEHVERVGLSNVDTGRLDTISSVELATRKIPEEVERKYRLLGFVADGVTGGDCRLAMIERTGKFASEFLKNRFPEIFEEAQDKELCFKASIGGFKNANCPNMRHLISWLIPEELLYDAPSDVVPTKEMVLKKFALEFLSSKYKNLRWVSRSNDRDRKEGFFPEFEGKSREEVAEMLFTEGYADSLELGVKYAAYIASYELAKAFKDEFSQHYESDENIYASTTLSGVIDTPEGLVMFNVGDSPCIHLNGDGETRITKDHVMNTRYGSGLTSSICTGFFSKAISEGERQLTRYPSFIDLVKIPKKTEKKGTTLIVSDGNTPTGSTPLAQILEFYSKEPISRIAAVVRDHATRAHKNLELFHGEFEPDDETMILFRKLQK